jgi:prolyl-tRNA synthetase
MADQAPEAAAAQPARKPKPPKAPKPPKPAQAPAHRPKKQGDAGKEIIGITVSKEEDFPQWYQELVIKAEMVEYYNEVCSGTDSARKACANSIYRSRASTFCAVSHDKSAP